MFVCLMIVITNEMTSAQIIQNNTFGRIFPVIQSALRWRNHKVGDTWYWYGAECEGAITIIILQ